MVPPIPGVKSRERPMCRSLYAWFEICGTAHRPFPTIKNINVSNVVAVTIPSVLQSAANLVITMLAGGKHTYTNRIGNDSLRTIHALKKGTTHRSFPTNCIDRICRGGVPPPGTVGIINVSNVRQVTLPSVLQSAIMLHLANLHQIKPSP